MMLTFYCMINFTSFLEVQIKTDPLNDNVLMARRWRDRWTEGAGKLN